MAVSIVVISAIFGASAIGAWTSFAISIVVISGIFRVSAFGTWASIAIVGRTSILGVASFRARSSSIAILVILAFVSVIAIFI